jgi:CheY-like chemotaxis protein
MSHFTKIDVTPQQRAASAPEFASILIVDDQQYDRTRLKKMCRALSFSTQISDANSLAAMRKKLAYGRFDLILLDFHLTDGTGLQGVELIRADNVNNAAAVVMITGTEQRDVALQALKSGFCDYLTKDELSEETLTRTAITALQKSQLARGMIANEPQPSAIPASVQSFSRECAHDIKPIVSRMMRQMRELREIDHLSAEDAAQKVERVEGSLRRLWAFLDELDQLAKQSSNSMGPTVAGRRRHRAKPPSSINVRVPSERLDLQATKRIKPPSIFRRQPG